RAAGRLAAIVSLQGGRMHSRVSLPLTGLVVAVALSLATATASALRLLFFQGSTTVSASGILKWVYSGNTVECVGTVTRTVSRVIPKIAGTVLGAITRMSFNMPPEPSCRASFGELQQIIVLEIENPAKYRLKYQSIFGTLPIITGIRKTVEGIRL